MLATSVAIYAQGIPDPTNEAAGSIGFIQNVGQVINTDNNQVTDINYHSIHAIPKSYYQNNKINFVYAKFAKDTINNDTLARLDMSWIADGYGNTSTPSVYETTDEKVNYYLAHCNSGCDQLNKYSGLLYENIYDNIDMRMYSNNVGYKIYFVVRPGGNPQHLRMLFDGQTSLDVSLDLLTINIGGNSFSLPGGIAYEYDASGTSILPWTPQFNLNTNGTVEVTGGAYNTNKTLVYELGGVAKGGLDMKNIDWSVAYGGEGEDVFYDVDVNSIGAPHAAGYTFSAKIPMVTGIAPFQANLRGAGSADILVVKFNADLSLSWSTFYGGNSDDGFKIYEKYGISLDKNDNAFIAAPTRSTGNAASGNITLIDITSPQAYKDVINNGTTNFFYDLVIARFNNNGQLTWATFFGGEDIQDAPHFNGDIIVDKSTNEIYVGGFDSNIDTYRKTGTFPHFELKPSIANFGTYIIKFNKDLQHEWCSYLKREGNANISSLEIDASHRLLVTGRTDEGGIPIAAPTNYYSQSFGSGYSDGFVTRFNTDLTVNWSTYIGGGETDGGNTIITTKNNKIVILGTSKNITSNGTFPIYKTSVTNVYNQPTFEGETSQTFGDATICTFTDNGKKENFTYLGGAYGEEYNFAACANNGSNVFLSGLTKSKNFRIPTIANQTLNNFYLGTTKNIYNSPNDERNGDVYIMGLNKDFVPEWTTFYGGSSSEIFWADVCFNENLYFVGTSSSNDFPLTFSGNAYPGITYMGNDAIISRAKMNSTTLNTKNDLENHNNITIFPNPAYNKLYVSNANDIKEIYIYDLLGKLVKQMNMVNSKTKEYEIAIDDLTAGIYIIQVVDVYDAKLSSKFIKE